MSHVTAAYPLVEVHWLDSMSHPGWCDRAGLDEALRERTMECISAGYLYQDTADNVVLIQSQMLGNGNICGAFQIPKAVVVRIAHITRLAPAVE